MIKYGMVSYSPSGRIQMSNDVDYLQLRHKGQVTIASWSLVGNGVMAGIATVSFTNLVNPIMALRFATDRPSDAANAPTCAVGRIRKVGSTWEYLICCASDFSVPSRTPANGQVIEYYLFDKVLQPNVGEMGLYFFKSGVLKYSSRQPLLNIVSSIDNAPREGRGDTFTGPVGRKYAFIARAIPDSDADVQEISGVPPTYVTAWWMSLAGCYNFPNGVSSYGVRFDAGIGPGAFDPGNAFDDNGYTQSHDISLNALIVDVTGL